jgi:hypothetical protein
MQPTGSFSEPGSDFDAFLYAQIGEDSSGLPLSVLSALARMDLDPWKEAGELAALPAEAATRRLASLLGALPDESLGNCDRTNVATRLIALLRLRPRSRQTRPTLPAFKAIDLTQVQPRIYALAFVLCFLLFLLFSHFRN